MFVDVAGDVAVEVRQQYAASTQPYGAHRGRRRLHAAVSSRLQRLSVLITLVTVGVRDDVQSRCLAGVCSEMDAVCPMFNG